MRLFCPRYLAGLGLSGLFFAALKVQGAPTTGALSAASFYVPHLPDLHQDPQHPLHIYAGEIPSDPKARDAGLNQVTAHLFFLMLKARRSSDRERVIFWFNGGPGCSSFDGAFMESGPFRIDGNGGLKVIEGGWNEFATVIFIDQPAGTGLSYTSTDHYVQELSESGDQFIEFLRNFYQVFPEYQSMDTYLTGESYAGQFIPYIADAILESNLEVPLRGAAIGNGWIDGRTQYPAYLPFSLKAGVFKEGSEAHKNAVRNTESCMEHLNSTYGETDPIPPTVSVCEQILPGIIQDMTHDVDGQPMCINIYDIRLTDTSPACGLNWPTDLTDITKYLRRKDVIDALHAKDKSEAWRECNGIVGGHLRNSKSKASIELFPKLLDKIKMLLFVGDQDLICNSLGMEYLIENLQWQNQTGLGEVKPQGWSVNGTDAGTWVEARNLTYVKIFNASHMVPYDVPHVTHDMILRFMDVDFKALTEGTAKIPSNVGVDFKPSFEPVVDENKPQTGTTVPGISKSPEQDKAMWEAYYNAGSAALILVLIAVAIGLFFWIRSRRRQKQAFAIAGRDLGEESIPLTSHRTISPNGHQYDLDDYEDLGKRTKGKERANPGSEGEAIFDVGDSDEEDDDHRKS
ncbi:hypothetical protein M422DRAFT_238123 [Sphaerobolus stellatus SS14]|nr:hypothetical protein M422DRAFT_238123 [Sphaerobolus stellatus SS14]